MNNLRLVLTIALMAVLCTAINAQEKTRVAGISYGFNYTMQYIWVGEPYNFWTHQQACAIVEGFYYRNLSKLFQIGTNVSLEFAEVGEGNTDDIKVKVFSVGALWLGHFPDNFIQFQVGGFTSFNYAVADYEDGFTRRGIDYGIIAGPAIEYENFGLAIHHHAGFTWYPDAEAKPDEFGYANSKIKVKVYYRF